MRSLLNYYHLITLNFGKNANEKVIVRTNIDTIFIDNIRNYFNGEILDNGQ